VVHSLVSSSSCSFDVIFAAKTQRFAGATGDHKDSSSRLKMTPSGKTIGVITSSFPRDVEDFAGRFVFEQVRALSKRGYRVEVITPESDNKDDFKTKNWDSDLIRLFPAPYFRPRSMQKLFYGAGAPENMDSVLALKLLAPAAVLGLFIAALKRARGWDAIISHWMVPSALAAGPIALSMGLPHLAQAHSGDIHMLQNMRGGPLLACAITRGSSYLGFVTEGLRKEFMSLTNQASLDKAKIMPMGFDPEIATPLACRDDFRAKLKLNGFTVLFLGRLVPIKGLSHLIAAIKNKPWITLIIAGDGPDRSAMEDIAKETVARVIFLGRVNPSKRADLLAACDAMVLPSVPLQDGRHEGLPLAIIEAMAAGLPVAAARTGGIDELVIDGKTGLLFDPGNIKAITDILERMATDSLLIDTLTRNSRIAVKDRIWNDLVIRLEELLWG